MRRALLIARRDYIAAVRTRAFLIGLILAPMLFGGGFLGVGIMRVKPDLKDRRVVVVDYTGAVADSVLLSAADKNTKEQFDKKTGKQTGPRYLLEKATPDAAGQDALRLALSDQVRSGELAGFVEIGPDLLAPSDGSTSRQVGFYSNAGGIDQMRNWLGGPVNDGLRMARLERMGIDPKRLHEITAGVPLQAMSLVARDEKTGAIQRARKKSEMEGFLVPYSLMLLLAMMVMLGASPMLGAVTHDKSQRVVEMLLGAATPTELMAGKVIAATAVSLTSSAVYVVSGFFVLEAYGLAGLLSPAIFVWFYIYLLADMIMLCALAAALGALCSTPQEAQHLAMVVIAPVVLPLFVVVAVMSQPNSALATALSLFPLFTPLLMLVRQAMPAGVPAWQPWVGLAGVAITVPLIVWAAARIFRIGIMLQGKPPKGAEILRWAIRG